MSVTIAAIAGSLRAGSHTRALLRAAASDLPPGIRLTIWDGLAHVPPFSEDAEAGPAPAGVAALRALIAGAGAVLIVTPEYNGSIPGQLKNALDWASRPRGGAVLAGKPAAAISASPSPPRRRLGPGGPAQGPHRHRRRPDRHRAGHTPGPHPAHPGRPHRRPGAARPHHRAHQRPGPARHRRQPGPGRLAQEHP